MPDLDKVKETIAPVLKTEHIALEDVHDPGYGEVFAIDLQTFPGLSPNEVVDNLRAIKQKLNEVLGTDNYYLRSKPEGDDSYVTV